MAAITITSPITRYIKKSGGVSGSIAVSGTITGPVDQVEIRFIPRGGIFTGTETVRERVPVISSAYSHSGIMVPNGYYDVEVVGYQGYWPLPGTSARVEKVGVGFRILTCGQSNATNSVGSGPTSPITDGVMCWNPDLTFSIANDPQPIADGFIGSVWPTLGDLLVTATGMPVELVCCGLGGSGVDNWTVAADTLWPALLHPALSRAGADYSMVLWHQGESDADNEQSQSFYYDRITSVIDSSREILPDLPWGIAVATWWNGLQPGSPAIQAAQIQAQGYTGCFAGANTDTLDNTYRLPGGVHMNDLGIVAHATLWRDAILAFTGL